MKLLDGRAVADVIKQRHASLVAGLGMPPKMAIIRTVSNQAGDTYLKVKRSYGADIGVPVDLYVETPASLPARIKLLNQDSSVTGIVLQLPLGSAELTKDSLAAVSPGKDIDGLGAHTHFETGTPKAIVWLLAAHNIDIHGRILVIGQGRLVGKPLGDRLEQSGQEVIRADIKTKDLPEIARTADFIFTATGRAGLITPNMIKPGVVIVDAGSPLKEVDAAVYDLPDVTISANPGGVGPMTVAALFDNLLIAANA